MTTSHHPLLFSSSNWQGQSPFSDPNIIYSWLYICIYKYYIYYPISSHYPTTSPLTVTAEKKKTSNPTWLANVTVDELMWYLGDCSGVSHFHISWDTWGIYMGNAP